MIFKIKGAGVPSWVWWLPTLLFSLYFRDLGPIILIPSPDFQGSFIRSFGRQEPEFLLC